MFKNLSALNLLHWIKKNPEPIFFNLIILLNLIPVLAFKFFPSLDGPAHLYNSQLIGSILTDKSEQVTTFFKLNETAVPNLSGHFILAIFNYFLPAFIAEKILLLIYLIALPMVFRFLVKQNNPSNLQLSYLVFPFTYSMVFCLGFYNFSLGVLICLWILAVWLKEKDNLLKFNVLLKLFLLVTLCYFSHIFMFVIVCIALLLFIFLDFFSELIQPNRQIKIAILNGLKKGLALLLVSSLALPFFFSYYSFSESDGTNNYADSSQLIGWLLDLRPIIAYNYAVEKPYTITLFLLLSVIFICGLIYKIKAIIQTKPKLQKLFAQLLNIKTAWLLLSFICLFFYFTMPDNEAGGGYISIRFAYLFFIFFILWLTTLQFPKWIFLSVLLVTFYCRFNTAVYQFEVIGGMNNLATEFNSYEQFIPENSVVLPVNFIDYWFFGHFSNYLAADKPIVVMENYHCTMNYFPVVWNNQNLPKTKFGEFGSQDLPCMKWKSSENNKSSDIDFVFISGNLDFQNDSCQNKIYNTVKKETTLIYFSKNCALYKVNKILPAS